MRFKAPMGDAVRIRVATEEKAALKRAARQRGMSLSEYLRMAAAEAARQEAA